MTNRNPTDRALWWNLMTQCEERGSGAYSYVGIVEARDARYGRRLGYVLAAVLVLSVLTGAALGWW